MAEATPAQAIESFHLLFLQALTARSSEWFVLKGGANIRYFFGSVRYSNDIDLDFIGKEGWQVEQSVDSVLNGAALRGLLGRQGIELGDSTKSKQTDTTRRWKLGLLRTDQDHELIRTKIEFSSRGGESDNVLFETVPDSIVGPYGIRPPSINHYGQAAAIEQKIAALALRSETKARDVFDLELLLRMRRATHGNSALDQTNIREAVDRAQEVSFQSFLSEVIPFLDPSIAELYGRESEWDQMRTAVVNHLSRIEGESMKEEAE